MTQVSNYRISREVLMQVIDNFIDEIARLQKANKEIKETAVNACELVYSLVQQVDSLEKQLAAAETRDFNRAKRIGKESEK